MPPKEVKSLCAALGYADGVPTTQSQRVTLGLRFALETGMRTGEIFSLRATNVDYKNRVAHLPLRAYADRGYFNAPQIKGCADAGIVPFVPKPLTSNAEAEGRFDKCDFRRYTVDTSSER
jgi:hypothetical protein